MAKAYFSVSAPRELMQHLEDLIGQNPELGYRTASSAAVEGIRQIVDQLEARVAAKEIREFLGHADDPADEALAALEDYVRRRRQTRRR
jgi:hypothetical protein